MKHRLKHRLTLIQDVEIPDDLPRDQLESYLRNEHQNMFREVVARLRVTDPGAVPLTHAIRRVVPSQGFEVMM